MQQRESGCYAPNMISFEIRAFGEREPELSPQTTKVLLDEDGILKTWCNKERALIHGTSAAFAVIRMRDTFMVTMETAGPRFCDWCSYW